jgi:hypothetical protein
MNPKNRTVRAVIAIGFLCLLPAAALATGQQPDVIIYNGKTYALFSNPLEQFYKDQKNRPLFRVKPDVVSTANWRGYVATWAIENGFLYLVKIDAWICRDGDAKSCRKVKLRRLFGSRYRDGKVKANWFSGDLCLPDGKLLKYVHMGYGSVYERELTLSVESGRVMKESVVDNTRITLPSELELQRRELEKIKPNPVR